MTPTVKSRSAPLIAEYRAIVGYFGLTLALVGGVMLTPLLVLFAWPGEWAHAIHFLLPGVATCLGGTFVYRKCGRQDATLSVASGGLVVVLSWLAACFVSTWPLIWLEHLNFTQAFFETMSGWTTTGLSVVDVTKAKQITLLWRSTMQAIGGAGFAVIMLAALAGPVGTGLSTAEGRSEQLLPHVRASAKVVFLMYSCYCGLGTVAYRLAGMNWFDAVNHSFAAISTGGFSTKTDSIGHWNSATIETVSIALMLLGSTNFLTAYTVFRGRWRVLGRDGELSFMGLLAPVIAGMLFFFVCLPLYSSTTKSARVAIFETVTALTTTGFATVSYTNWSGFGIILLIGMMIVGGGSGSTAGGMKQYRVFILVSSIVWEIRRALNPNSMVRENFVWHGGERDYIDDVRISRAASFACLYLLTLLAGTLVLAAHGYSLSDSFFEFASAQGTVGISVGVTQANAPSLVLWVQIAGMFLGRLEFLIIFVGIGKLFRDLPRLVKLARTSRR